MHNSYIEHNLFGYRTAVQDTSYVVFNLYLHKLSKSSREAKRIATGRSSPHATRSGELLPPSKENGIGTNENATLDGEDALESSAKLLTGTGRSCLVSEGSVVSSTGSRADTISQVLCPFVEAVTQMEQLPLHDALGLSPQAAAQRASRERFLRTVYANPLPAEAAALLDATQSCAAACRSILRCVSGASGICAVQPPTRSQQVEAQGETRRQLAVLKAAKAQLEDALNALTDDDGADDACGGAEVDTHATGKLYDLCTKLYDGVLVPRISACEVLCAARSALVVRSEDAVELAVRALSAAMPLAAERSTGNNGRQSSFRQDGSGARGGRTDLRGSNVPMAGSWFRSQLRNTGSCPLADVTSELLSGGAATARDLPDSVTNVLSALPLKSLQMVHVLVSELPPLSLMHIDALHTMGALFRLFASTPATEAELDRFTQGADDACDALLECGIHDAESWMEPRVRSVVVAYESQQKGPGSSGGAASVVHRQRSFGRQSSGGGFDSLDAPSSLGASTSRRDRAPSSDQPSNTGAGGGLSRTHSASLMASRSGVSSGAGVVALLAELQSVCDEAVLAQSEHIGAHASLLYDTLGRINLFLKRMGLAHEIKLASMAGGSAGGKVVPAVSAPDGEIPDEYLPHTPDPSLGFDDAASELYSRACLLYKELAEQQRVTDRLEMLSTAPDEDFFKEAHDDLFKSLFIKADEHCVMTAARATVQKRVQQLLVVRIKLSHHNGEVRVMTVPQTTSYDQVLQQFSEFWPSLREQCDVTHVDEDDRILLSTDREYQDLLRHRRNHVIDGLFQSNSLGGSQTFGRSLAASTSTTNALKLELFADPKKPKPVKKAANIPPSPVGVKTGPAHEAPAPHTSVQSSSALRTNPRHALGSGPAQRLIDQVPTDMSINDFIRTLDKEGSGAPSMDDIQRQYDRRSVAMGIPLPAAARSNTHPPESNSAVPPRGPPVLREGSVAPPAVSGHVPPAVLQPAPTSARQLFLAMGKAKREGGPPTIGAQSQEVGGLGDAKRIEPPSRRWGVPRAGARPASNSGGSGGPFLFAQHSFQGEESFLKRSALLYDDDGSDTADAPPSWNRGGTDHARVIMHGDSSPLREPQRFTGPMRRSAVPLPKEAKGTPGRRK